MNYKLLGFLVVLMACSSTEPMQQKEVPVSPEPEQEIAETKTESPQTTNVPVEYPYLSSLSDTYYNRTNTIPDEYVRLKKEIIEKEKDLYEGYRVQIFSGQSPALADTAARHFRIWSAENIEGYQAETYTFFKAPHYRVHVGDFHDRDQAIEFSNLIKSVFRDSWVVYDRVNPFRVPADTVVILTKR